MSEAERLQGMIVALHDRLGLMADRWDKAVFDHSLEPTFGDDYDQIENRRVLFENRPLADWEAR